MIVLNSCPTKLSTLAFPFSFHALAKQFASPSFTLLGNDLPQVLLHWVRLTLFDLPQLDRPQFDLPQFLLPNFTLPSFTIPSFAF